jgi:multidrug efflux pump subunit AcrB
MIITHFAIQKRISAFVLIVLLVIGGGISYLTLPREGYPDITIPFIFISAPYEGVAPEEVENLITIPMEKQLNDLENVREIKSTSAEGIASISIEFLPSEDIDTAIQRVKDKIDLARIDLPQDLDEPIVQGINFSTDIPILRFSLSGDNSIPRLKAIAEDLQERIELLRGVRQVGIYGGQEREIRIEIDPARLQSYGLTLGDVMRKIGDENKTTSAGNIEMPQGKFQIRIPGEFKNAYDMRNIIVARKEDRSIYLSDVATAIDTFKDRATVSRVNGAPCVTLDLKKRNGENSVRVINDALKILNTYPLPPGLTLTVTENQASDIRMMVEELENNIASGFVLVVLILLLFLGRRNSLLVGVAIPLSMLLTFLVLAIAGQALNMIVLFSLVMAVGMLVDNAIVIVENTYRLRSEGLTSVQAARQGASEVAWPVITSTLTTVVAFAPLFFWPDIIGQFMSFLPKTLVISLLASLAVALIINPAICSAFIRPDKTGRKNTDEPEGRYARFVTLYERVLRAALQNRLKILFLGLLVLVLSVLLYGRFGSGVELFPEVAPRRATIAVKLPEGAHLEKTDALLTRIEGLLKEFTNVKFFVTTAGAIPAGGFGGAAGTHMGAIFVEFLEAQERTEDTRTTIDRIRERIGVFPGVEIKVEHEEGGPPTGAPISIEVAGEDFEVLQDLVLTLKRKIGTVPGLVDLQDDFEEARPEIQFRVDRARAAQFGLDTGTIGDFLRTSIYGAEFSKFRVGEDQYDITLRLPRDRRNSINMLRQMFVPLPGGRSVPLASLGEPVYTGGRGVINRKDQKRVITVNGNTSGGRGADEVLAEIQTRLKDQPLPAGYTLTYVGENKDMDESGAFLAKAFLAALGLIFLILVIQFNSVLYPLIIMFSVILSLVGVIAGLLICNLRFGVIMTGVGVISLAGVVVNNSIVLVDCMEQLREKGLSPAESIVEAGRMRLRPVLLTAITTILGLIPMAIGWSVEIHTWPPTFVAGAESSTWWAPMAVAVIFGLSLATLLTLVQVPVMCSLADSLTRCLSRKFIAPDPNTPNAGPTIDKGRAG